MGEGTQRSGGKRGGRSESEYCGYGGRVAARPDRVTQAGIRQSFLHLYETETFGMGSPKHKRSGIYNYGQRSNEILAGVHWEKRGRPV